MTFTFKISEVTVHLEYIHVYGHVIAYCMSKQQYIIVKCLNVLTNVLTNSCAISLAFVFVLVTSQCSVSRLSVYSVSMRGEFSLLFCESKVYA